MSPAHVAVLGAGPIGLEAALAAVQRGLTVDVYEAASEPARWAGRTVLLTGAGHSAQTAARTLAAFARDAPGTRVEWAIRAPEPTFGAVAEDALPDRAALNAGARELAGGGSDAVRVHVGVVTEAWPSRRPVRTRSSTPSPASSSSAPSPTVATPSSCCASAGSRSTTCSAP